jgi:hypothetical protein
MNSITVIFGGDKKRMAESKGQPLSIRMKKVIKEINDHILVLV